MDQRIADEWSADLDALHAELSQRHINLYHRIPREEFVEELEQIRSGLPDLTPNEVELRLWRLLHSVGGGLDDGHTAILIDFRRYQWVPLQFSIYGEDVRVVGSAEESAHLCGARLTGIGGVEVAEALRRLAEVGQFVENQQSERFFLATILSCADVLAGIGLSEPHGPIELSLQRDDGEMLGVAVERVGIEERGSVVDRFPVLHELIVRPPEPFSRSLWFSDLAGLSTTYIRFDRYPPLEDMERFGHQLTTHIRDAGTRRVIIDLRTNFGCDGSVGARLAAWLLEQDGLDWESGLFVLIGAQTYSAAAVNAVQFRQLLNARLVGEATGGNPVGYQDAGRFVLPNSGLVISYSKRIFRMQDVPTSGVQPDVLTIERWHDRKRGVDVAVEWVVRDIQSRV